MNKLMTKRISQGTSKQMNRWMNDEWIKLMNKLIIINSYICLFCIPHHHTHTHSSLTHIYLKRCFLKSCDRHNLEDSRCRGGQRKNWLTNTKDWTGRLVQDLLIIAPNRREWWALCPCQLSRPPMCCPQRQVPVKGQIADWYFLRSWGIYSL